MHSGLEVHRADVGFALSTVLGVRVLSRAFGRRVGTCGEGGPDWRLEAIPLAPEWRKVSRDLWLWWDEAMRREAQ